MSNKISVYTAGEASEMLELVEKFLQQSPEWKVIKHFKTLEQAQASIPLSFQPQYVLICTTSHDLMKKYCEVFKNSNPNYSICVVINKAQEKDIQTYVEVYGADLVLDVNELEQLKENDLSQQKSNPQLHELRDVAYHFKCNVDIFRSLGNFHKELLFKFWEFKNPTMQEFSVKMKRPKRNLETEFDKIRKAFDVSSKGSLYDMIKKNESKFKKLFEEEGFFKPKTISVIQKRLQ